MVVLYQLFFSAIILISSLFGLPAFLTTVLFSLLFTFSNVFTAQLLVIQTTVILSVSIIGFFIAAIVSLYKFIIKNNTLEGRKYLIKNAILISLIGLIIYYYNYIIYLMMYRKILFFILVLFILGIILLINENLRNNIIEFVKNDAKNNIPILIKVLILYTLMLVSIVFLVIKAPFIEEMLSLLVIVGLFYIPTIICKLLKINSAILFFILLFLNWKYISFIGSLFNI